MREEIVKRLKCPKCNKIVHSSNKYFDNRFYCMVRGMNLGIYYLKQKERKWRTKEQKKNQRI